MDTNINVEVPEYFICPISLQIMKDPVTAVSGITYDRESIEYWLFKSHNTICPVTKQPLPSDSDLTPNHTLRRLIQAWCTVNAAHGVDRIPTPKPPLSKFYVLNLVTDLSVPSLQVKTLQKLEALAVENERNKSYMVEAGLVQAVIFFIVSCYRKCQTDGLEEALSLFYLIRNLVGQENLPKSEMVEIVVSLTWVLSLHGVLDHISLKPHAAYAVKSVIRKANPSALTTLRAEFFETIIRVIREGKCQQGINALLHVLLSTCSCGRNRMMLMEAGAVFELIELELRTPEKKTTELTLGILFHLCSCADGRAQLLNHAAGIAVITRRILKISNTTDDRAILIVSLICKYSAGTNGVLQEMLRVGTVAKLCIVLQADCASHLKDKAREILRTHFDVWKDSPCIDLASLTRYTR